jgi:hypothetical protein
VRDGVNGTRRREVQKREPHRQVLDFSETLALTSEITADPLDDPGTQRHAPDKCKLIADPYRLRARVSIPANCQPNARGAIRITVVESVELSLVFEGKTIADHLGIPPARSDVYANDGAIPCPHLPVR